MTTILHINSSGRYDGSYSRKLTAQLVERLVSENADTTIIERDLARGVEFIDEAWIGANFTAADQRSGTQKERLANSDSLVAELTAADIVVIGVPLYNFSVPAVLKAWIDQIARANLTFRYEGGGPVGLLEGKRAYIVMTSGGTELSGPVDYASDYLRHVLGFVGIKDVTFVTANQLMVDEEAALNEAHSEIAKAA